MKFRRIIAIVLSLVVMATSGEFVYASNIKPAKTKEDIVQEIVQGKDFTQEKTQQIKEGLELLEKIGIEISTIKNVSAEEDIVYYLPITKDLIDEITIKKSNGDIIMKVVEGSIRDELIFQSDGKVFLDGKEVIYETGTLGAESVEDETITPRTGGIQWYDSTEAPSYLKNASYGSYSVSWKCWSINLQNSLRSIAYSTLWGLITDGLAGGAIGFSVSAFYELITFNPDSTCISYIDYVARGSSVARYYKGRRYTYSEKNFQGKKTTTYSYGLML